MERTAHLRRNVAFSADVIAFDRRARGREGSRGGSRSIRVLLAAGEGLVRAGLRALLKGDPEIAVVAEAASGAQAVALAAERRPDVCLVDVRLPGIDGLTTVRRISADPKLAQATVLMLTEDATDAELFGALRAGARGLLTRESDPEELRRAVRLVARGEVQLSPGLTRRLIEEFTARPGPEWPMPERLSELTAREREVVALIAAGLSNREIADQLAVSPATAKTHVSRAMNKMCVHDRAQLVAIAYETGFAQAPRAASAEGRSRVRSRTLAVA
jgi:DNA-binding NarL/FixJ family response regulator